MGIFVKGQLRAVGSPDSLKSKYGKFLKVTVREKPGYASGEEAVMQLEPSARPLNAIGGTKNFEIERNAVKMSVLFRTLLKLKKDSAIVDFSVATTSLEEAFLRIITTAASGDDSAAAAAALGSQASLSGSGATRAEAKNDVELRKLAISENSDDSGDDPDAVVVTKSGSREYARQQTLAVLDHPRASGVIDVNLLERSLTLAKLPNAIELSDDDSEQRHEKRQSEEIDARALERATSLAAMPDAVHISDESSESVLEISDLSGEYSVSV